MLPEPGAGRAAHPRDDSRRRHIGANAVDDFGGAAGDSVTVRAPTPTRHPALSPLAILADLIGRRPSIE
jgi:hypothetical protein